MEEHEFNQYGITHDVDTVSALMQNNQFGMLSEGGTFDKVDSCVRSTF